MEFQALKSLKRNQDIIKHADEGSAIIIMDKQCYINEGIRQLSKTDFSELPTDLSGKVIHRINLHAHDMGSRG